MSSMGFPCKFWHNNRVRMSKILPNIVPHVFTVGTSLALQCSLNERMNKEIFTELECTNSLKSQASI